MSNLSMTRHILLNHILNSESKHTNLVLIPLSRPLGPLGTLSQVTDHVRKNSICLSVYSLYFRSIFFKINTFLFVMTD